VPPIAHQQLHQPSKRLRTNALIRQAINDGKPLPLQVMLEAMWELRDESMHLASLPPEHADHNPTLARELRKMAIVVAEKAAPYVHPRLSNVAVRPEDEEEAEERRAANRLTSDLLKGKSVKELGELWLVVAKGDSKELAEITHQPDENNGQ
jgi:hypothetical protein